MSNLTNMKFKIGNPQQSEELQRVLFGLGYQWFLSNPAGKAAFKDRLYLFAEADGSITYTDDSLYFNGHPTMLYDTTAFIAKHTKKPATKPHRHSALIHLWAEGAEIQQRYGIVWCPVANPSWDVDTQYRVKPSREFPRSSLTIKDLLKVVQETPGGYVSSYHAMADAAVQRYILDTEANNV